MQKQKLIRLIEGQADDVPDLLAWTRNKPRSRVPAVYSQKGDVWQQMQDFLKKALDNFPEIVTLQSIIYLRNSIDSKDRMLYAIIDWLLQGNMDLDKWEVIAIFDQLDI